MEMLKVGGPNHCKSLPYEQPIGTSALGPNTRYSVCEQRIDKVRVSHTARVVRAKRRVRHITTVLDRHVSLGEGVRHSEARSDERIPTAHAHSVTAFRRKKEMGDTMLTDSVKTDLKAHHTDFLDAAKRSASSA